jgi:aminoglycoside 6'-N-acetyltransferase
MNEHSTLQRSERYPILAGERVTLRPGTPADADTLRDILAEPSVSRWWGEPDSREDIAADLSVTGDTVLLVIEVDQEVAGGIQYFEESDPAYRHAGIDLFLAERFQGRGLGVDAIRTLARFLIDVRGHHRLTIDPAATNERAIRSYEKVGFRRVGTMRKYERAPDGTFHDGLLLDLLATDLL